MAALRGHLRALPDARRLAAAGLAGVLLFGGGNGLVVLAELHIPSGLVALVLAISPLLVALTTRALFKEPIRPLQAAGMALGFAGLVVLAQPGGASGMDGAGLALSLGATVLWTAGSVFSSRARLPESDLVNTSAQLLGGGLTLLLMGMLAGEPARMRLDHASPQSVLALLYLITFGSLVAFSAFTWLVRNAPLPLVFTYVYVNPVVAVALGALVAGERVGPRELAGGAIILAGVAIIVTGRALADRIRAPA